MTTHISKCPTESTLLLPKEQPSPISRMCRRIQDFVMGDPNISSNTLYTAANQCFYSTLGDSALTLEPDTSHWNWYRDNAYDHYPRVLSPFGYMRPTWYDRSVSQVTKLDPNQGG